MYFAQAKKTHDIIHEKLSEGSKVRDFFAAKTIPGSTSTLLTIRLVRAY
jgi:hypothetical protein